MSRRADEVRKRMARRRRLNRMPAGRPMLYEKDDPASGMDYAADDWQRGERTVHPLWNKDLFLLKIFGAALLVLVTAILFQAPSPALEGARAAVTKTFETDFKFAAAARWYEKQFGKPLALLPVKVPAEAGEQEGTAYVLPASAKITEPFDNSRQGIMLETERDAPVEAMTGGVVLFAGKKDDIGNTVVIQHPDGSESWYGNLESVDIMPRVIVKSGDKVGTVTNSEDELAGQFYFAIRKDGNFIDPKTVMSFD